MTLKHNLSDRPKIFAVNTATLHGKLVEQKICEGCQKYNQFLNGLEEELQQLSDEQLYGLSAKWLRDEVLGVKQEC